MTLDLAKDNLKSLEEEKANWRAAKTSWSGNSFLTQITFPSGQKMYGYLETPEEGFPMVFNGRVEIPLVRTFGPYRHRMTYSQKLKANIASQNFSILGSEIDSTKKASELLETLGVYVDKDAERYDVSALVTSKDLSLLLSRHPKRETRLIESLGIYEPIVFSRTLEQELGVKLEPKNFEVPFLTNLQQAV